MSTKKGPYFAKRTKFGEWIVQHESKDNTEVALLSGDNAKERALAYVGYLNTQSALDKSNENG